MPRIRNPCSLLPRRLQIVASLTGFVLFVLLFLGGSSPSDPILDIVPYGYELEKGAHEVLNHVPYAEHLNPFGQPIHRPPPEQKDSSSGDVRWFSDFEWRNPFSSSTTLDEERAVLPPKRERTPVYTYFDPTNRRKDEKSRKAEQDLLQIWRRAWWAQGFKPIVLGRAEAMNNPHYRALADLTMKPELETEIMRWLAWGDMGTGILCNWLAMPMAKPDDPLLAFFRRGVFPELTRFAGLDNGLFVGSKESINKAIRLAMASTDVQLVHTIWQAVPKDMFVVDAAHSGIAFYSSGVIEAKYPTIKAYLDNPDTRSVGMAMLPSLINSHLQMRWQSSYPSGIAVLKPFAQNTSSMVDPALKLAEKLTICVDSPLPASCPPNMDKCLPCDSAQRMRITTPKYFKNSSTIFTIGTVPHPLTMQSLIHSNPDINLPFIRRKTDRDVWIMETTKDLLNNGVGAFDRLLPMKDAVATDFGVSHNYWRTAENEYLTANDLIEMDFIFGFQVPRSAESSQGKPLVALSDDTPAESLALQLSLLERSKRLVHNGEKNSKDKQAARLRTIIESWNLADTEAWKFVRAWNARRKMEWKTWEDEEARFLGKGLYDRIRDYVHA